MVVTTRRSKRRMVEEPVNGGNHQPCKSRFTAPPQQFHRTTVNLSKLDQKTGEATLGANHTVSIPTNSVFIQQTKNQLQDEQLSDRLDQATFKNSVFQASQQLVRATQDAQTMEESHEANTNPNHITTAARSLNLTEFAEQNHNDDDLSDVDSIRGDASLICIRGYRVKSEHSTLFSSILSKHGDIGAKSRIGPILDRSFYIEKICDIVQQLKASNINNITKIELDYMRAFAIHIRDTSGVEVGWLINRLNEIYEAKIAMPKLLPISPLKLQHAELKQRIAKAKEQLEGYKQSYLVKHEEALALKSKISAAQADIAIVENQARETAMILSESRAKLSTVYHLGSLVNGLME